MAELFTNIAELVTNDPIHDGTPLGLIHDAAIVTEHGQIAWVGRRSSAPSADVVHDLGGCAVIPGFVDSHAHLVFAGDRAGEYAARMAGESYAAGGIRSTVAATRAASDEQLEANLVRLLAEMRRQGTTTVEVKSGYGLTTHDEARSLAIASRFTSETTYLGAHVVPEGIAAEEYVELVAGPMLDRVAEHARWIDVFCERGAFDADQARTILQAGKAKGLLPRMHANQLGHGPGIEVACEMGAASADHCTFTTDEDLRNLADAGVVATLLPGVEFSTRSPYPDARRFFEAGVTLAIASDCNPGSCFTSSMPFCIAVAVRDMFMTPAQAMWAATAGGAKALLRKDVGHLSIGARADFVALDAPSYLHLAYRPGVPLVTWVSTGDSIAPPFSNKQSQPKRGS